VAGAARRVVKIQYVDDGDDSELAKALAGWGSSDTKAQVGHSQKGVVVPPEEAEAAKQPMRVRGLLRRVPLTERLMPAQMDPRQRIAEPMRGSVLTLDEMASILRARLRVRGENIGVAEARMREALEILTTVGGGDIDLDFALQWAEEAAKAGTWARDEWGYIITPALVHEAAALVAWEHARLTVRDASKFDEEIPESPVIATGDEADEVVPESPVIPDLSKAEDDGEESGEADEVDDEMRALEEDSAKELAETADNEPPDWVKAAQNQEAEGEEPGWEAKPERDQSGGPTFSEES
jgi:hypothetical protein